MGKWKCGICNSEFDNYQAQGFNEIIYCPLCYFKELYKREKQEKEDYKSRCEKTSDKLKRDYYINFYSEHNDNVIDEVLDILQNGGENNGN